MVGVAVAVAVAVAAVVVLFLLSDKEVKVVEVMVVGAVGVERQGRRSVAESENRVGRN